MYIDQDPPKRKKGRASKKKLKQQEAEAEEIFEDWQEYQE